MSKSGRIVLAVAVSAGAIGSLCIALLLIAPVMRYPIAVDLPQRVINPSLPLRQPSPPIDLRVDAGNQIYWNENPLDLDELRRKMEEEVRKDPANPPALRIDAAPDSGYEVMARILGQAKEAGIKKIDSMR